MNKLICAIIAFILITFSGCVERKVHQITPQERYITYNIGALPEDLIMLKRSLGRQRELLTFLFEGLVKVEGDGTIAPAIAESWEVSKDGIGYTFNIREDAFWSDGSEIVAEDFVDFFSEILARDAENEYDYQLTSIYGVSDYRKQKSSFKEVAVRALDKKQLQIRLNNQNPDLLKILAQPIYGLRTNLEVLKDWKNKYSDIRFSGAYLIKEIKADGSIVLSKNEHYWEEHTVSDGQLLITGNIMREVALADFQFYKSDIITEPPISELKDLMRDERTLVVYTRDILGVAFNFQGKDIVRNINFRKAVNEVLDPAEIADSALPEFSVYIDSVSFSGTKNVFKDNAFKGNKEVNRGKKYFEQISLQETISLRLAALNTDKNRKLARTIAEKLNANLKLDNGRNIRVEPRLYNKEELEEIIKNNQFDLLLKEYESTYESEFAWLERWNFYSKENVGKFLNLEYENTFRKAQLEDNPVKRKAAIEECKEILNKELPVIPLFYDVDIVLKNENIQGLEISPLGHLDLRMTYKEKPRFQE
jgi:oligopeptide transport system substrate-binding protein